jgi:adenine-specific DNA-methyltransferase
VGQPIVLPIPEPPADTTAITLDPAVRAQAAAIGEGAALLDPIAAGYRIGEIYTAALPDDLRARYGIYYTPPALTRRLLALATAAGVDWATCRALDPACGGGAFLTPVALTIAEALAGCPPLKIFQHLCYRLRGAEIDPFSAWMSQVLLEAALLDLCRAVGRRLPPLVAVCDSLRQEPDERGFDLVIGNPPYGRVTLPPDLRAWYRRSLYGHANLYGVFTDLAIRWTRPGGVIAFVTPTSFLGGEYFKALRGLLAADAPPVAIDLVTERKGVFADVLQETLLAVYRHGGRPCPAPVHVLVAGGDAAIAAVPSGEFVPPERAGEPWLLPRTPEQAVLIERMRAMPHRLRDYGYQVSTGPLVWNRHKPQLRSRPSAGTYPLIWAEAVTPEGRFVFRSEKKNHQPYFQPRDGDEWLIARAPCVLVQRTTAKEQSRRLIAAELPAGFVAEHGAVVIENHLNMVRPVAARPPVSPTALTALLNSDIVDEAFRCINGSVAVSAYELEALPLPTPGELATIDALIRDGAPRETVNRAIRRMYLGEGA